MIKVYDQGMQLVAYHENAFTVGYTMPFNSLWTASFSLPATDEKNAECNAFRYVEIYDEHERLDLYRILPSSTQRASDGSTVTYQCEHVIATLLDDVLFQYHTVGNLGYHTNQVIEYVLSKQTTIKWQLGICSINRQFEYNWENDNLLGALFSVPKPFDQEYMWTWDTTTFPWTLNLVEPPQEVDAYIRYGVNMQGIRKDEDPTNLCTRLYCLGYGEGINQLNITDLNNGLPYLDADTQSQYGIISKVWADRSFEHAETLMARGQAILDQSKTPRITYAVDASDLSSITSDPLDKFKTGTRVRVIDEELGIDIISRVAKVSKGDIFGSPGNVSLEIANRTQDIATSLAELSNRQRINETYAQGATNVNIYDLAENCDPTHPAKFRIWIPDEAVRINKMLLSYENEPFRANSRAVEAAPSTTSGPSSRSTTLGGGGETISFAEQGRINFGVTVMESFIKEEEGHYHEIYDFSLYLPEHTHGMEHEHTIDSHTHDMQFGIYSGPTATAIGLLVDGNVVGGAGVSEHSIDLVDYLELDEEGRIKRGQFHEIEIIPNKLSRVAATVIIQFFVQSRGGGDY